MSRLHCLHSLDDQPPHVLFRCCRCRQRSMFHRTIMEENTGMMRRLVAEIERINACVSLDVDAHNALCSSADPRCTPLTPLAFSRWPIMPAVAM